MATIRERERQDGGKSYEVQIRLRGQPSHTKAFRRLTDARKYVQDFESAARQRRAFRYVEGTRHTLAETVDRYLYGEPASAPKKARRASVDAVKAKRVHSPHIAAKKDLKARERSLLWWRGELGPRLLADITPPVLAEVRDRLAAEMTNRGTRRASATTNRLFAYLSALLSIAVREWQWLESNPLRSMRKLQEPRGRVRFLSDEERAALLSASEESPLVELYPIVVLALSTGARRGEIEWLRWKDIDLKRSAATLHDTKNGERRTLYLSGPARELLVKRARLRRRIDTDLVFPRADGKAPIETEKHWRIARTKAGLNDFRFHDLRHSAASYLAMNGATLAEIAAVLGHKTLAMVKRYAHLSDQHTAGVIQRMNEKIFGK